MVLSCFFKTCNKFNFFLQNASDFFFSFSTHKIISGEKKELANIPPRIRLGWRKKECNGSKIKVRFQSIAKRIDEEREKERWVKIITWKEVNKIEKKSLHKYKQRIDNF